MGKAKEIKALPSMIQYEDGSCRQLKDLTSQETQKLRKNLAEYLELQMDYCRKRHPEERDHLL